MSMQSVGKWSEVVREDSLTLRGTANSCALGNCLVSKQLGLEKHKDLSFIPWTNYLNVPNCHFFAY